MATGGMYLSGREVVPLSLFTSPPLGGTLGVHRTSWRIPFRRHASGAFLVPWVPRCFGIIRPALSTKAAQALGCSLTPGLRISFDWVTCMALATSVSGLWALGFLLLRGAPAWGGGWWSSAFPWFGVLGWWVLGFRCSPGLLLSRLGLAVCACGCGLRLYVPCFGCGLRRVCFGAGCGVGGGHEGRGVAPVPFLLAVACGLCPVTVWDITSLFLAGFVVGACG